MGTIVERRRKNGAPAYLAKISIMREGQIVFRENKTFDRRPAAVAWIAKREEELAKPGAIERAATPRVTLAQAIDTYTTDSVKEIGRTKAQVLNTIKTYPIADMQCDRIGSADIVSFAQELSRGGRAPSTVGNYLSHLAAIFGVARPAWGYPLDRQAMEDAFIVAKRMGIVGKSNDRDRRPTLDELDKLLTHFSERATRRSTVVPMVKIIPFAIFSTRRQEEIIRIRWDDLEAEHNRVLVRDMKNPGEKIGNDVWCDLPPEALRIIQSMPKLADQIFPYTTDAIGAAFTRASLLLGINTEDMPDEDRLKFHDLRHDGISRLFEIGWGSVPHVAAVSGHRSWKSLQRYTHIRQKGDKYAGWKWLEAATAPLENARITKKGGLPRRLRSQRNGTRQ